MTHAALTVVVEAARTSAQMDEAGRQLWQGHAAGLLNDEEAQALAERLQERRSGPRKPVQAVGAIVGRISMFPPRRAIRSPDRIASRDRRRLLASSGPMPPVLAARYTEGQRAALKIIADEVAARDECALCIDAIAARAGICRRLVQIAIRLAEGDGLLTVEERPRQGRKNDPNLIRIVSREWQAWIARASKKRSAQSPAVALETVATGKTTAEVIGCRTMRPSDRVFNSKKEREAETVKNLPEERRQAQG
jgi:hypothetical protein